LIRDSGYGITFACGEYGHSLKLAFYPAGCMNLRHFAAKPYARQRAAIIKNGKQGWAALIAQFANPAQALHSHWPGCKISWQVRPQGFVVVITG